MPLEIKRKEKESAQSLIRRFSRRLKKSGILVRARRQKFFGRKKSQQMKKRAAIRREEIKKQHTRAEKLGQKIR